MKLLSLSLRDFRCFESCDLEFPDGLIGMRGANGSGKSTVAEAIGWALFGKLRPGSKVADVKRQGAEGPTSVELEFRLGETVYRVRRVLSGSASLWIGDAEEAESTQTRATNVAIARELGITWDTFQRTVFARQKDVAALDPSATKAARTQHVERLLGLSRYREAAAASKARAKELADRLEALRDEAPPLDELRAELAAAREAAADGSPQVAAAEEALAKARAKAAEAEKALDVEQVRVSTAERLDGETARLAALLEELDGDLAARRKRVGERCRQQGELDALRADAVDLDEVRATRALWEALAGCQAELEAIDEPDASPGEQEAAERSGRLDTVRAEIEELSGAVLPDVEALQRRVDALSGCHGLPDPDEANRQLATIAAERDHVRADLHSRRDRIESDKAHLDALERNGSEEPCPICLRPYGDDFDTIRDHHRERLQSARDEAATLERRFADLDAEHVAATDLARRAEQAAAALSVTSGPDDLEDARAACSAARSAVAARETTLAALRSERDRLTAAVGEDAEATRVGIEARAAAAAARARLDNAAAKLGVAAFDAAALERARAAVRAAETADARRRELEATLAATANLAREIETLEERWATRTNEREDAVAALDALAIDPAALETLRTDRETARGAVAVAADALQEARLLAQSSDQSVAELMTRVDEADAYHARLAAHDTELREHKAATKLLSDFRAAQSQRAWPSLEQGAGALLSETTEGRYGDVRMTDDYKLEVIDRGEWHGLERYSGGEQDLANLCLRLAIADWVTRSRETELGMVVLDEVFGSQDEERRQRLITALRSLEARFHQLIVITHVPEIADLCDHQLLVRLEAPGRSVAELVNE